MAGLFSNYFGGSETSRFVGQLVDLGDDNKLKIKKVIAEGMYPHTPSPLPSSWPPHRWVWVCVRGPGHQVW